MLKSFLCTVAAAALLMPAANAQTENHEGHNHDAPQTNYTGPMSPLPEVEYALSEAPDDHVIGEATAPVTLIAYASVTCSHCSKWFIEDWPAFKKEQIDTGKVRFIMREFPTPPQEIAAYGFTLINCAPEKDYFDNLVYQMENQKMIFEQLQAGKGKETYDDIAKRAGLDDAALETCFANEDNFKRLERAVERGRSVNVTGVPSFFIDGEKVTEEASAAHLGKLIADKTAKKASK